jgi:spore coat protein H
MKALALLLLLISPVTQLMAEEAWQLYDDSQVARVDISCDWAIVDWLYQEENLESDSLHPATIHFQNALIDEDVLDMGFRLRGNTSRYSQKKSFKLSFNEFVDGREWFDVDKLNLNGEHNDPSIVRSKLCWDLYQQVDVPASRAAHAEVWINDIYFGLYVNVEHVDDEFLWKHFPDDTGNLWKCLWPADLTWQGDDPDDYKFENNGHRTYELKSNEDEDDYTALYELIRLLEECPDSAIEDSLMQYLDVGGVLQYFAMNVLTASWDDYWFLSNNYYLYHDPSIDRMTLIPYDYDNTFSIDWFGNEWALQNPYTFGQNNRPLAERIFSQPRWRNLYTHILEHWMETLMSSADWEDRLLPLYQRIYPSAQADTFRTLDYGFTMMDFINSWGPSYQNAHVKRGLREYLDMRRSSLAGQLNYVDSGPEIWQLDWEPRLPGETDSLRVTSAAWSPDGAGALTLLWSMNGADWQESPMNWTGDPANPRLSVADRWEVTLPPMNSGGELRLKAVMEDGSSRVRFFPPLAPRRLSVSQAATGLALNEFLASNDSQGQDQDGEFDDWVELFNTGDTSMPLAGCWLTDDPDNLLKWEFPPSAPELAPGEFLLVWCDEDEDQAGLHASFKLSAGGEFLALTAADGVSVHDSLSFGPQETDVSLGRLPDGVGSWQALSPSPGESNANTSLESPNLPAEKMLAHAWPNPFNGTLHLSVSSPVKAWSLFDLAGRKVDEGRLTTPATDITLGDRIWHERGSGLYLLRLEGNHQQTQLKVMHLK